MTKTTKSKATDPVAAVRKSLLETVDAVTEGQEQVTRLADTEFTRAKTTVTDHAEKAKAAVQANVEAAVAASEIVVAGAEKIGALALKESTTLADKRVTAIKKVINAKSFADAVDIQTALFKAEQEEAAIFAKAVVDLAQGVATDAFKPVQAQVMENLKAFNVKAA